MNWLEKEVTNIELSKKLKELRFPQDRGLFWVYIWKYPENKYIWELWFSEEPLYDKTLGITEYIKAYTCSELGEYLPNYIETKEAVYDLYIFKGYNNEWVIHYRSPDGVILKEFESLFEANVRAKMFIWLKKNGYINFNSEGEK